MKVMYSYPLQIISLWRVTSHFHLLSATNDETPHLNQNRINVIQKGWNKWLTSDDITYKVLSQWRWLTINNKRIINYLRDYDTSVSDNEPNLTNILAAYTIVVVFIVTEKWREYRDKTQIWRYIFKNWW